LNALQIKIMKKSADWAAHAFNLTIEKLRAALPSTLIKIIEEKSDSKDLEEGGKKIVL
jgi:hypothetical protein